MKTLCFKISVGFIYMLLSTAMLLSFQGKALAGTVEKELRELDQLIGKRNEFTMKKLAAIEQLKASLAEEQEFAPKYSIYKSIVDAYKSFQCDSLIEYNYRMLELAKEHGDRRSIAESQILLASSQLKCGLYEECMITLAAINREDIGRDMLDIFYWTECKLYRTKAYITRDCRIASKVFLPKSRLYQDSLSSILERTSPYWYDIITDELTSEGNYSEVLAISQSRLKNADENSGLAALLWYNIATAKGNTGDPEGKMLALIKSAKADILSATKDHASLHEIAQILFNQGDIDRSAGYMQVCAEDAMYFNANLRSLQLGMTLPVIMEAYNQHRHRQITMSLFLSLYISVFLVACIIFLVITNRQRRQLADIKQKLENANIHLSSLNGELQESDYIKENYVAYFIKQNSDYISRTHELVVKINKCLRKGKTDEALSLASAADLDKNDITAFYETFDDAFLSIFPDFVEKFNELIRDEYKYPVPDSLHGKKSLSSELRVYALIRLGFNDSSTLAEMLRYSVNSIYNIRSKVKAKSSVPKDEFEEMVRKISVV